MDKQREEFEAWCHKNDQLCTHRYSESVEYSDDYTQLAWLTWQEARKFSKSNGIPVGWVLVPKEPTERMLDASRRRQWDQLSLPMEDMDMLKYKAMIEALENNYE